MSHKTQDIKPKNYWNHRILAHKYKGEIYLQVHEVHYDKGKPNSYTKDAVIVGADELNGITWVLDRMKESTNKPILWAGDKWPKEYKPKCIIKKYKSKNKNING